MATSERQQIHLLKKQQKAEAEAAAAAAAADAAPPAQKQEESVRKQQPTKKKNISFEKKREKEKEANEHGSSSSDAEFGEEKPVSKKRHAAQVKDGRNEDLEEGAEDPPDARNPRKRLNRMRTKPQAAVLDDSANSQEEKANDEIGGGAIQRWTTVSKPKEGVKRKAPKAVIESATQPPETIPSRERTVPKKTEMPRDDKPRSLLTNLTPASTAINPTIASIRTKTIQPSATTVARAKLSRGGDATRGPPWPAASHVSSAPPVTPTWNETETPERRTPPPPPPPQTHALGGEKDPRVLQALEGLCESLQKDTRFQIRTGPAVDMSGSFLSDERYSFFDVDDAGDILLQQKIPIFPEDFPPGMPEWPLKWWGIIDPALTAAKELIRSQERPTGDSQGKRMEQHRPPLQPPPPQFRSEGGGRGGGWGRGGGGGRGDWGRAGRGPPPPFSGPPSFHGGPSPPFPLGPTGRGGHQGDWRPPESNWRQNGPPPDRR
jgi:hypothetical protein